MHHFFEAITNTKGDSLVGFFARVIDPITLAVVPIYADNSATPILTVSGVANMAKTDAAGNLSFYVAFGTYHLDIYNTDSSTFALRVQNVAMAGDITDAAAAALAAAQAAAAAALVSQNAAASSATGAAGSSTSAGTSATTATAQAAAATTASATSGAYPNSAASNVPRGLTQASVGAITAGSGGTNGTFALAWSSGNFAVNPTGTFTVAGGVVTAVTITGPGLYIGASPTVPTPSFAASSGLSGAAVALTAQFLVTSGQYYWVQSADGSELDRYQNVSGTATAAATIGPLPTVAAVTAAVSGAIMPGVSIGWVGPPNPAPASPISDFTIVFEATLPVDATLVEIDIPVSANVTAKVRAFDLVGGNVVRSGSDLVLPLTPASHHKSSAAGDFTAKRFLAGQRVGFYVADKGYFIGTGSTVPQGGGYYAAAGDQTTVATGGSPNLTNEFQAGFRFEAADGRTVAIALSGVEAAVKLAGSVAGSANIVWADWNHAVGFGQSNDPGTDAAVIHSAPSAVHKTFDVGVKMSAAFNDTAGSSKALVEDSHTALNWTGSALSQVAGGETGCFSFAVQYSSLDPTSPPVWFMSAAGVGSTTIRDLHPAGLCYPNLIYHVTQGKAVAAASGKSYAVPFVRFMQGEADQYVSGGNTSQAAYLSRFYNMIDHASADIMRITGQLFRPQWLITTPTDWIAQNPGATLALLQACDERDDCHLVGPSYFLPFTNLYHLTGVGQSLKGAREARAAWHMAQGRQPDRVRWLRATSSGTTLTVIAEAPTPLAINTTITPLSQNNGVKVVDGGGTLTLSAPSFGPTSYDPRRMLHQCPITWTLNRSLGAGALFRYALDYLGAGLGMIAGASGNIFDTTTDSVTIMGTSYSLPHAAPPVQMPVTALEAL